MKEYNPRNFDIPTIFKYPTVLDTLMKYTCHNLGYDLKKLTPQEAEHAVDVTTRAIFSYAIKNKKTIDLYV